MEMGYHNGVRGMSGRQAISPQAHEGRGEGIAMKKATTPMKKTKTAANEATAAASPSQQIDARIAALGDWRDETLARVRALIRAAVALNMEC